MHRPVTTITEADVEQAVWATCADEAVADGVVNDRRKEYIRTNL